MSIYLDFFDVKIDHQLYQKLASSEFEDITQPIPWLVCPDCGSTSVLAQGLRQSSWLYMFASLWAHQSE